MANAQARFTIRAPRTIDNRQISNNLDETSMKSMDCDPQNQIDKASRVFAGYEYIEALDQNYPGFDKKEKNLFGFVGDWKRNKKILAQDQDRYIEPRNHPFKADFDVWKYSTKGDLRWISARATYKGLINGKPPFDLVLYSNLIWELQPITILEFGALQGGSSLWLADQQQILCGGGEVHSFELLTQCIHARAKHPNLQFHHVNLQDLKTIDRGLLDSLPHPWLVIDDAHCNIEEVIPFIAGFMEQGDYYVIEDVFMGARGEWAKRAIKTMEKSNLLVDQKFTDAFGLNITCSPNAWLIKR